MTKVISFSLWGNIPKYTQGAIRNAELALKIYPDWECWFFCRNDTDGATMVRLSQIPKTRVIFVDKPGDWTGMFDRFVPASDSTVEAMISRDCDSRLGQREKDAVDEWLRSDELIHIMRDHPHHSVPMLGGMWGVKGGVFPNMRELVAEFLNDKSIRDGGNYWQVDQEFLACYIWTYTRRLMTHDDGFWTHLWGGKPFPSPRSGLEFVGQVFDENEVTVSEHLQALAKAL